MAKIAVFKPLKLQNRNGSKIPKFPHCVEETKVLTYLEYHVTQNSAEFSVKNQFPLFVILIFSLLFTFSNFVYKTEQLKAHALLALETFCFDFFSVFENTNKNVNFRCEAQNSLIFTIFTPNQE